MSLTSGLPRFCWQICSCPLVASVYAPGQPGAQGYSQSVLVAGDTWLGETYEGSRGCTARCSADVHSVQWQLCMQQTRPGAHVDLTKFVLSPALRPAASEWVSPPENSWDWHTASGFSSKCLCSPTHGRCFCVSWLGAGKEWCLWASLFSGEVPQPLRNQHEHICLLLPLALCKLPCLHCLSTQARTWLSLILLDHPVLGQLTSKAPGSKLKGIQPLCVLMPNVMEISLPCVSSLVWGLTLPILQAASLHLSDLPNLSDAASLYLGVEFVLPVFGSLSGSWTWMWMLCSWKHGTGWAQGPPTLLLLIF